MTRNGPSLRIPTGNHVLKPWGNGVEYNKKLGELIAQRPKVTGHKLFRVCKDTVYLSIREMCVLYGIHGNYAGLAAAHAPEIYAGLYPYIHGKFTSFQDRRGDYNKVKPFFKQTNRVHPHRDHVSFDVHHAEILWALRVAAPMGSYSFLDFDTMRPLSDIWISRMGDAIDWAAADKVIASIWHAVSRKKGEGAQSVDRYRRSLDLRIVQKFEVVRKDIIDYYEPQTGDGRSGSPMRVDIYTLRRNVPIEVILQKKLERDMTLERRLKELEERKFQERLWKTRQASKVA
jgi:hypothetical protein